MKSLAPLSLLVALSTCIATEDRVVLKNGTTVSGRVEYDGPDRVFLTSSLGLQDLDQASIKKVEYPGRGILNAVEILARRGKWSVALDRIRALSSLHRAPIHLRRLAKARMLVRLGQGRDTEALGTYAHHIRNEAAVRFCRDLYHLLYLPGDPGRSLRRERYLEKKLLEPLTPNLRETFRLLLAESFQTQAKWKEAERLLKKNAFVPPRRYHLPAWKLACARQAAQQGDPQKAAALVKELTAEEIQSEWYRYHFMQGILHECQGSRSEAMLAYVRIGIRADGPMDARRLGLLRSVDLLRKDGHQAEAGALNQYLARSFPFLVLPTGRAINP